MPFTYDDFDLSGIRTYPLKSRPSKARVEDFGRPVAVGATLGEFLDALPNVLGAMDLRAVARAVATAAHTGSGMFGASAPT